MALNLKSKQKKPLLSLKSKNVVAQTVRQIEKDGSYFLAQSSTEFIPSGCAVLDCALGGGWPRGRIVNVVGDKAVGKTLLAIEACCNFVLKFPTSGRIRYCEPEASFDQSYAAALGLSPERVDFAPDNIDTVEALYKDVEEFCKEVGENEPALYILDSLDALSSTAEKGRDFGEAAYGDGKAKDMSKFLRMINGDLKRKKITLMIISQLRDNIGVAFGEKQKRSGGKALDFYADVILWLAQIGKQTRVVSGLTRVTGIEVRAKVKKNKVGIPFREADFSIRIAYGIDDISACVNFLKKTNKLGLIQSGMTVAQMPNFIEKMHRLEPDALRPWMDRLRTAVRDTWMEIEQAFLPERQKYGH